MRDLARETGRSFSRHGGRLLGGAIAFSALLSVAPLLVIALHVAGVAVREETARAAVTRELATWIGDDGARTLGALLDDARARTEAGWSSALSALVLVYASTRLFGQLKRALDHMWDVQPKSGEGLRGKAMKQLRKRALSFLMVVFVGLTILALVVIKAAISAMTDALGVPFAWHALDTGVSLATMTLLFAVVFKVLPDVELAWRDAWAGAIVTAILFSAGTLVIGLYLGHKALGSMYGAAGSIVMLLLWVHYSAQMFFVGVAFTAERARLHGRPIGPNGDARRIVVEGD
jgi:membrane protein